MSNRDDVQALLDELAKSLGPVREEGRRLNEAGGNHASLIRELRGKVTTQQYALALAGYVQTIEQQTLCIERAIGIVRSLGERAQRLKS